MPVVLVCSHACCVRLHSALLLIFVSGLWAKQLAVAENTSISSVDVVPVCVSCTCLGKPEPTSTIFAVVGHVPCMQVCSRACCENSNWTW